MPWGNNHKENEFEVVAAKLSYHFIIDHRDWLVEFLFLSIRVAGSKRTMKTGIFYFILFLHNLV